MEQRSKSRSIAILIHILVWGVFGLAIFYYLPFFSGIDLPREFWIRQFTTFCLLVVAFYFNAFVLVPVFLLKNHKGYYFAIILGIVIGIVLIDGWGTRIFNLRYLFENNSQRRVIRQVFMRGGSNMLNMLTLAIFALVLGISTSLTVMQHWQKDKQRREELEKEKVRSELSFLKAQINPHFFFNTLNNIYVLTQVDAAVAGKAIHQLSRMMRYLLYEIQQGQTLLSQEIDFLRDYISLMQLRLTEAVTVSLVTPSVLQDMPIAPMMLLPFVENAFKHGVSATRGSHIDIEVQQRNSLLDVTIKNSIMKDKSVRFDTNSGIGMANTRRRLDLLYPGKYTLTINEQNAGNEYTVHLILDLS